MILRMPEYYKKFHCIAGDCKESCCSAGWIIEIDSSTADKYNHMDGKYGEKIRKNITSPDTKKSNQLQQFILNEKHTCPFLTKDKLCELFINIGEENLCQICQEHPRFFEWYNNEKEVGIGLCCEEAARIILTQNESFKTSEIEIPYESPAGNYDEEIYNYLFKTRALIIKHIENTTKPLTHNISEVLNFANIIQDKIDNFDYSDFNIADLKNVNQISDSQKLNYMQDIFDLYLSLDYSKNIYKTYLENCFETYKKHFSKLNDFETANPEINTYLKNISIYFVWRYYLKSTYDEEIYSKIFLMSLSILILKTLYFTKWIENGKITLEDCIYISKKYSEEIEYCDENIDVLENAAYEQNFLTLENFISYFI